MKLLGIDYGESKIGLAISYGFLAEPLKIIYHPNLENQIADICQKMKIEKIIIGLSEGRTAIKTKIFSEGLNKLISLPIEFQDETLTSQEAIAKMIEVGKRVEDEDAFSAALILQSYLDKEHV